MEKITLKHVEYISHKLAIEILSFNEPIPDFSTRYPHKLESCIAAPFQYFGGKSLYTGLVGKAAILFYLMNKNHPFQNGNKRIAMTTLLVFLYMNKKWLNADPMALYNFGMWVASSPAGLKKGTVQAVEDFIHQHLVDIDA
jgi:death-on-curing family protein